MNFESLNLKQKEILNSLNSDIHSRVISNRFVLYLGFKCNLRCQFCYYLKSIEDGSAKNDSFESLSTKIQQAKSLGKIDIDLTGGEATIHPDFEKILLLCKELRFRTINVISNGIKLANLDYFSKMKEAGLNEVLLSIHSHLPEVHDSLTKVKGSHKKIIQAAQNAKSLGIRLRVNACVNEINYPQLSEYLENMATLNPSSVNLIVFNPTEETPNYEGHENIRISSLNLIAEAIQKAIDLHGDKFPVLNVRFLPFCLLKGKEAHIRTYWQEIYEAQEWDPILHWAFRKGWVLTWLVTLSGFFYSLFTPRFLFSGKTKLWTKLCEYFQNIRIAVLFKQPKQCKSCSLRKICPGIHRDYLKTTQGNIRLNPYGDAQMPLIQNPVFFGAMKYPEKFPSEIE